MTKATKPKLRRNRPRKNGVNRTLDVSIKNLRESLNGISMEKFVAETVESLMQLERDEFLDKINNDKGNGFYEREFKSMRR